jgi:4-hydroxy-tetrahydrodipicolinate reductase
VIRLLLVGYGRMGKLIDSLAVEYGCEVVGVADPGAGKDTLEAAIVRASGRVDAAVDFSLPEAVVANLPSLASHGINIVIGTTGWGGSAAALRETAAAAGIGVVAAPNFSTGVVLFDALVARAAELFASQPDFGAFVHESHHAAKKDAPSGTALLLHDSMVRAGFPRTIDMASTRAGFIPGTHTVGFDGPAETITLTHAARDRTAFARGALLAAKWVTGKRGWFTMRDVLGLTESSRNLEGGSQ